jgi:hypothetical protein
MDITALIQSITPWLITAAPYLLKLRDLAGEEAVKEVSKEATKKIGERAWEATKDVWGKLMGTQAQAKPDLVKAVQDVANDPSDEDTHAAVRVQLKKLLTEDAALKEAITQILKEAKASGVSVVASGERSVATGGDVIGSTITTGDSNTINK